jgi:hypothetical protein
MIDPLSPAAPLRARLAVAGVLVAGVWAMVAWVLA